MLRHAIAILVSACLVACASLDRPSAPARLLERAREEIAARDFEGAYRHLAEIRTRHPDSAESRAAFPLAASIFKHAYFLHRYEQPPSRWVASEPGFMLDWFASFFASGAFPQAEADALFVGMHYGYFRDFLARAETQPELARWRVRARKDNGIVESISAEHRDGAAPSSEGRVVHSNSSPGTRERNAGRVSLAP